MKDSKAADTSVTLALSGHKSPDNPSNREGVSHHMLRNLCVTTQGALS